MNKKHKDKMISVVCINTGEIFDSIKEATDKYNIGIGMIGRVCKGQRKSAGKLNGSSLRWMFKEDYDNLSKQEKDGLLHSLLQDTLSKKIICVNTKEEFFSLVEASKKYNISSNGICECCRNKSHTSGELNGVPLIWMYLEDYKKLSELEISEIIKERCIKPRRRVICINTMEIFNSIVEASLKYDANNISSCCLGKLKSSGQLNGEKLYWMYYEDYLELEDNEKKDILKTFKNKSYKTHKDTLKVICLNTEEVFNSTKEASNKYNIPTSNICNCCNNKAKSAGKLNGEKLYWMYYKDYLKQKNA